MYKNRKWVGAVGLALIFSVWGLSDAKAQSEATAFGSKPPQTKSEAVALERLRAQQDLPISNLTLSGDVAGSGLVNAKVNGSAGVGNRPTQPANTSKRRLTSSSK